MARNRNAEAEAAEVDPLDSEVDAEDVSEDSASKMTDDEKRENFAKTANRRFKSYVRFSRSLGKIGTSQTVLYTDEQADRLVKAMREEFEAAVNLILTRPKKAEAVAPDLF